MKKIQIPKCELEKAIEVVNSKKELAKYFNTTEPTISRILKENNLPTDIDKYKRDIELGKLKKLVPKEYLIENYVNTGKSLDTVTRELNLPPRTLEKLCKSYGITKPYKYTFNKEKFYDMTNPNTYYVAGLVATDGYLDSDAKRIEIRLVGDDEFKLLENINSYYESTNKVGTFIREGNYKIHSITYSDYNIKEFYSEKFNIPCINKTFTLKFPEYFYDDMCLRAYILGCLDGDGCITHLNKIPDVGILSASKDFMCGLSNIITEKLSIKTNYQEDNYFSIRIFGKEAVKFLDWVYEYDGFKVNMKYEKYLLAKDRV